MSQEDAPAENGPEPTPAPETKEDAPASKTFGEDYVRELRGEAAARRNEVKELTARIEEFETANASELEKAQTKAAKKEAEAQAAIAKLLRHEVADEKQVPVKARKYLTGTTREELEANADELIADFKESESVPDFDGGARDTAPEPLSPDQEHNKTVLQMFGLAD